ncbi:subtilisin-like protein [Myriangium duriaei CBS 260.36]|uniref:Subtilisin-like protein n=1 Tax=Myriangium duriaei CBS 260.36 TaxID=1168546 RepID=A0A9P4MER4_9PEZI|nr:subtilisin-like protein [Myriangium duriaei CBS 260.36]
MYYSEKSLGAGTYSYIVDSGVNVKHPQFEGRAALGYNAVDPKSKQWGDDVGHGTHIAGLIGSMTHGVASRTNLIAVKVLDKGETKFSQVLDGYQWAVRDIEGKGRSRKSVIHVSVYGPQTDAWNKALSAAFGKGISTVLPAGNEGNDVSGRLGGIAQSAIIVGATDDKRKRAFFASYGSVVTIWAPGTDVKSTSGQNGYTTKSGSAQAAAYVSGIVVYFQGLNKLLMPNAKAVKGALLTKGLRDIVALPGGRKGTFAYNDSGV